MVRGVDNGIVRGPKLPASPNGNSAADQQRRILREPLDSKRPPQPLKDLLLDIPRVGEDTDFARSSLTRS